MNNELRLHLYLESIHFNTTSAMLYINYVSSVMKDGSATGPRFQMRKTDARLVLDAMQQIVTHAGAVSRFLWPTSKNATARGEELRRLLQIPVGSPLETRGLRNDLEHFDERLDVFVENWSDGFLQSEYVGPSVPNRKVIMHHFRAYLTDTTIFEILGKQYDLQPLAYAIVDLHKKLEELIADYEKRTRKPARQQGRNIQR